MPFPGFRTKRNGKHPFTNRQSIFHKIRSTPSAQAPPLPNHLLDDTSFSCSYRSLPFHHAGCYEWVEKDPLFCGQRVVVTRFAFACIAERRILPSLLTDTYTRAKAVLACTNDPKCNEVDICARYRSVLFFATQQRSPPPTLHAGVYCRTSTKNERRAVRQEKQRARFSQPSAL